MGYQYINNYKNARKCVIREYSETDPSDLPDEKYNINLTYYDFDQLVELKKSYTSQLDEFKFEIQQTFDVMEKLYAIYKQDNDIKDFEDVFQDWMGEAPSKKSEDNDEPEEDKLWNELVFVQAEQTHVDEFNPNFNSLNKELKARIEFIKDRINTIYELQTPEERLIIESRLAFLQDQYQEFSSKINPFHIQPGLVLEVDITSIKRKKTTMMLMSNVLNEFLYNISKGFMDKAFAGFSRRRSTMREESDDEFASVTSEMDEASKEAMLAM
jgi:hypothetical protein